MTFFSIQRRPYHAEPHQSCFQLRSGLAAASIIAYIGLERLVRAGASPTWSEPEGSSHNESRLGRYQSLTFAKRHCRLSDCTQPAVHIPLKTLTAVYHSQPKA